LANHKLLVELDAWLAIIVAAKDTGGTGRTSLLGRLIGELIGGSLFVFWVGIVALLFSFGWPIALLAQIF
jgi:hypothetical protein